ncbi:hypothetical protein [Psychrobacter sp. DD43]|uniref:hypothetical protein n=1 Tax=Psychrobacter sp. DD43 TaxID=2774128 RepID=UPI0019198A6F|nr:hypothetical protein [Psychrobacter sp. DD43]
MSKNIENKKEQEFTTMGSIGVAIFFIFVGLVYLIPDVFPQGTLYLVAGILIVLVTVINTFKGIAYDWFIILFAIVCIVIGANKILDFEVKFFPVILIVIGVAALFTNLKKLRNQ